MRSAVYEWTWFKLGVMIDTVEFYILIQGHRSATKPRLLHQLLRLVGVIKLHTYTQARTFTQIASCDSTWNITVISHSHWHIMASEVDAIFK